MRNQTTNNFSRCKLLRVVSVSTRITWKRSGSKSTKQSRENMGKGVVSVGKGRKVGLEMFNSESPFSILHVERLELCLVHSFQPLQVFDH